MAKEIHEQPEVVGRTLAALSRSVDGHGPPAVRPAGRCRDAAAADDLGLRHGLLSPASSPNIGSSASRSLPVEIDVASEFRYREPPMETGGLMLVHLAIGRDGRYARDACAMPRRRGRTFSPSSMSPTSTIARESDVAVPTLAGPEIGVASTKAFTCQLARARLPRHRRRPARGTIDAARRSPRSSPN